MLRPPPGQVAYVLERRAPGLLGAFVGRVNAHTPAGTSATSWYRTPAENAAVKGGRDSQHLLGLAVDLVHPDMRGLAARLRRSGLVVVDAGDHVHVQAFPAGLLRAAGVFALVGL